MKKQRKKVRIRKTLRTAYIVILLAVIVISLFNLYDTFNSENNSKYIKANVYEYTNNYKYSYDVNVIENEYVTEANIENGNAYITELIDIVPINLTYVYNANQTSDITYTYQITGKLEGTYSKDGEEQKIFEHKEILFPMKENVISSDTVEINESLNLDLKSKIEMIKSFQQDLSMQINAKYTVLLEVVTKTDIMEKEVINVYSPDVVFEIGSKTTKVTTSTEETAKPEVVTRMVEEENEFSQLKVGISSVAIVISIILIILIFVKTENNNVVRNEYKLELNKILKDCGEKIVEVNSRISIDGQGLVDVKEFEEIIKVSEELFKPILYWNDEINEESWFCVIGNNIIYRYILKR